MGDWPPDKTFAAIESHEAACEAGTHRRALVEDGDRAVGLAWAPVGLAKIPTLAGDRTIAMQGPDGSSLLFVPLFELAGALTWAARHRGIDPAGEDRLAALRSLEPGAVEPATSALFDLIAWMVGRGASETRLEVSNRHDHPITLTIEPWAEEHVIEPNGVLVVVGIGPPGQFEVSEHDRDVIVHGWSGSTVSVLRDGVDIAESSKDIPSP